MYKYSYRSLTNTSNSDFETRFPDENHNNKHRLRGGDFYLNLEDFVKDIIYVENSKLNSFQIGSLP